MDAFSSVPLHFTSSKPLIRNDLLEVSVAVLTLRMVFVCFFVFVIFQIRRPQS